MRFILATGNAVYKTRKVKRGLPIAPFYQFLGISKEQQDKDQEENKSKVCSKSETSCTGAGGSSHGYTSFSGEF